MGAARGIKESPDTLTAIAPTLGVWAQRQLFVFKVSVRSFVEGYRQGVLEAESRDWQGIHREIFPTSSNTSAAEADAASSVEAAATGAVEAQTPPASSRAERRQPPAPPPVHSAATSVSFRDVTFVPKEKKRK